MTKDDIKERCFEVTIINKGKDGDTLCFKLRNDLLGEFIVDNCSLNSNPQYISYPGRQYNGNCTLSLDNMESNFIAIIVTRDDNPESGYVLFRC